MLADFVSFALHKEISLKEHPGAWFVLNTTEHRATHLYTFCLFVLDILSQTIKPYNVSLFPLLCNK